MNIKGTTKAFADRKDTNFITKESDVKNYSASDLQKLGEENVGDVLNQIADPQWVDPAKKMRTAGKKELDKDAFMRLMLTQMKYQDPTNPMQAHEMAAQLAAFTSVEQLQNLNTTMDGMKKSQAPLQQFEALNFIGKSVSGDRAQITRVKGDTEHSFQYKLMKDAEDVTLKVQNAQGDVVRSFSHKQLKAGANSIPWNGQDEKGIEQPPGDYTLVVEAKDKAGKTVGVETQFDGVITGVNYTPEGPLLLVGQQTIKLSDVKKIIDPKISTPSQDQKVEKNPENKNQDLKKPSTISENKKAPTATSNLDQIAMSRGLIDKVEKATDKQLAL